MTACYSACRVITGGGSCTLLGVLVIILLLLAFGGAAVLYRHRERLKDQYPYIYYGSIIVVLLIGAFAVVMGSNIGKVYCTTPASYPPSVDQSPGMVEITIVDVDNIDSVFLQELNGARSSLMEVSGGDRFTLRSNEEVINFLNKPENNITVPTYLGTKTVESVGELPFEYQEAPAGFVDPKANISNYDNASVATVACLYRSSDDFKIGGRHIPAGNPIPCSTPFLAQKIDSEEVLGTHVKSTSGPNKGETLVSPVTLKEGEYQLIGIISGQKTLVQSVTVTDEQAGGER